MSILSVYVSVYKHCSMLVLAGRTTILFGFILSAADFLPGAYIFVTIVTIVNARPYKDIEERLKILLICVALAIEHLKYHKLHCSSSVTSFTRILSNFFAKLVNGT